MTDLLAFVAALGAGLSAGVFFAFSSFVMKGIGRLPPATGIAAMQAINVAAPTPLFMTALFGTGAVSLAVGVSAVASWDGPGAGYRLAGCVLFLAALVLTAAYHVPRNDALAALDPAAAPSARAWDAYVGAWTAWNHVRTALCLAAATAFTLALRTG